MGIEEKVARLEGMMLEMSKRLDAIESRLNHIEFRINHIESRIDHIESRIDGLFKWIVGLILGMWATVMMTLIPMLLKMLGLI